MPAITTIVCRYCGTSRDVLTKNAARYTTCGAAECVKARRVAGGSVSKGAGEANPRYSTGRWTTTEKTCAICGTSFIGFAKRLFCSPACAAAHKARTQTGQTFSEERKATMKGRSGTGPKSEQWKQQASARFEKEKNPNWLGGREQDGYRSNSWYARWRAAVYERDGHACRCCGRTDSLVAHHIKEWVPFPELRYVVENGATLCRSCHQRVHKGRLLIPAVSLGA